MAPPRLRSVDFFGCVTLLLVDAGIICLFSINSEVPCVYTGARNRYGYLVYGWGTRQSWEWLTGPTGLAAKPGKPPRMLATA